MQNCYKGFHFFLLLQSENTQPQTVDKYRSNTSVAINTIDILMDSPTSTLALSLFSCNNSK